MLSPTSSVMFEIAGFPVHYYGVILFFAIIAALFVIRYVIKKYYCDVDTEKLLDILPIIIICSIIGARVYYVLMDFPYYSKHLNEIIAVWNGGMSIHGGLIGGILSGIILAKINKIDFFKYADVFSYGIVIGQAIGRFGNYFNCEAFGKPCSIPFLKLYIPPQHRPFGYENFSYFHPAFLYEALWDVIVFLVLILFIRKFAAKKNLKSGTIFFSYLILYSTGRILIEWCRIDSVLSIFGIAVAQFVSALIIVLSIAFLIYLNKKKRQDV